jgi:hypothetical protein
MMMVADGEPSNRNDDAGARVAVIPLIVGRVVGTIRKDG